MHYKTIMLEMLLQHPEIAEPLRQSRTMMPALESYSAQLKNRHEAWMEQLAEAKPRSDPIQRASEALEMALQEMENHLLCAWPPDGAEPLSLDAAMAFIKRHTPPA
jgi:hypothetical protein